MDEWFCFISRKLLLENIKRRVEVPTLRYKKYRNCNKNIDANKNNNKKIKDAFRKKYLKEKENTSTNLALFVEYYLFFLIINLRRIWAFNQNSLR